ncbi:MAG: TonB-dependent receptor [Bacteroidales bacterium]|nr:TonB-dependent receptor [Bacteroidales bacterium]
MVKKCFLLLLLMAFLSPGAILLAQNQVVKGVVVDPEGTPLPGVTIFARGKESKGVSSNIDGKYALGSLAPTDSIIFNYIGYTTQGFVVGNQTVLDVVLYEEATALDEVQVVAFATQKKQSVIGSIETINPKELKVPQSNLTTALAGRMAGIISYQRSGEPGRDNAEFFIRGVTTNGYAKSPLILIDNLEVTSEDLARLEPENIASFSIMKDATATALYGARGANGVILVTTKTGEKGKVRITTRVETNISTPTKVLKFIDGVDYMNLYNFAQRERDPEASLRYSKDKIENTRRGTNPLLYPNVNWYDELFKNTAVNTKATLTASGGGDIAQYYLSVAYTHENGLMKVDKLNNFNNNISINRYNIRANIDVNLTRTTKAAVKIYSLLDRYNGPASETTDIFDAIMRANPVNFPKSYPASFDPTYQYAKHILFGNSGQGQYPNPYQSLVNGYRDQFSSTTNAIFQIDQDLNMITKGLKARGMASFSSYGTNQNTRTMSPFWYELLTEETELGLQHSLHRINDTGEESLGNPVSYNNAYSTFYFEVALQYNRDFGKNEVGALLVGQAKESLNTIDNTTDSPYVTLPSRNLGLSGRFTYGYDSRYFIEANFGYNGSEKFHKSHRWGFFPSVGIGWVVSNEHWFPESLQGKVTNLKFKASYGKVGNDAISAASDRFFYLSSVNTSDSSYGYTFGQTGNVYYNGYSISNYANPEVGWETAIKQNYGIELALFGKANLQVEYFREDRKDIYQTREALPSSMGTAATLKGNIGKAKSHGIDASLDINWNINKDWWISGRFNYTWATSEYIEGGDLKYPEPWRNKAGQSLSQMWGYVAERLFIDKQDILNSPRQFGLNITESPEVSAADDYMPGDIKYVDINGDGVINESDQVPIGFPTDPEIIYGFGLSTGYKIFDFSFFFQGSARSSFMITPSSIEPFSSYRNALEIVANDYWSESNPNPYAFWPRLSTNTVANNNVNSTWWLRDGSFLRLKTVELGVSLPETTARKWGLQQARIFLSGNNLLCFSKFKLWDPEMGGYGIGYPTQRIYNIGINVTF